MSQGFVFLTPVSRGALSSEVVRTNLSAISSFNAGDEAPANPVKGMPWLDTSDDPTSYQLKVWSGSQWLTIAVWPFETVFGTVVRFSVTVPARVWSLNHGLSRSNLVVNLFDSNGLSIDPLSTDVTNSDTTVITHAVPIAGSAIVIG